MTVGQALPQLPFARSDVLSIAPQYPVLQQNAPVSRVRTPAGDEGWLVTRHSDVKRLIADGALGRTHGQPATAARYSASVFEGGPLGDNPDAEDARYRHMRGLLSSAFAPRRMRLIHAEIENLVDALFDELMSAPRPADFHEIVACPLPVMVACRLLGVPTDDRDQFRSWFDATTALYDSQRAGEGFVALTEHMRDLIRVKREQPGEDFVSDVVTSQSEAELDSLPVIVAGLLYAAYETTVERLDHGTLLLLSHPDRLADVRRDPELLSGAVEEILRVAAPSRPPRILYARDDIEIHDELIRQGDLVMLSVSTANHDPEVFSDPHRFDPGRKPNPHLSFGHGAHFCIGAALAKTEMSLVFSRIIHNTPRLRIALPLDELIHYENPATGGLEKLPLTWN
jgi:cytochrome P450